MTNENQSEQQASAAGAAPVGTDVATAAAVESAGINDQSASAIPVEANLTAMPSIAPPPDAPKAVPSIAPTPDAPKAMPSIAPPPDTPKKDDVLPPPAPKKDDVLPPPAPKADVAPVVQETVGTQESVTTGPTAYDNVNALLQKVPNSKQGIIHFLVEYARDMAPRRPVPEKVGANYQLNLYNQLHALINREDEHFTPLFTAVLRMFEHESDGCFRATHAFRFLDTVALNKDQRESFNSLIDMLRLLGPVQGRKEAAQQVSLSKVLAKNMTDSGRARVLSYFDGTI